MLVLSRKQKQQIRIGDDIVVTVLQIKGGSVRIGIEAPRDVHVMRSELPERPDGKDTETATTEGSTLDTEAATVREDVRDVSVSSNG